MKFCKYCGRELDDKERCSCPKSVSAKKKLLLATIGAGLIALIAIAAVLIATMGSDPAQDPTLETSKGTLQGTSTSSPGSSETEPSINSSETNAYTDADADTDAPEPGSADTTAPPVTETTDQDTDPAILLDPFEVFVSNLIFDGYNGTGSASMTKNEDALIISLIGEEPTSDNEEEFEAWLRQYFIYEEYVYNISVEISPNHNLSNGDEISVTVTVPDFLANRVMNTAKTFTVEGLADIQKIDVLDMFTFSLNGNISGEADLIVNPTTEDAYLNDFWLQIEPRYDLSSWDEVTVTLPDDYVAHLLNDYGILPTRTVLVLTVPQLSEYVTSADQLPLDSLQCIAQKFVEEESAGLTEDMGISYGEVNVYGYYFLSKKPDSRASYRNIVEIIVYCDMYLHGEYLRTNYVPIKFYNVTQKPDGTVSILYEKGDRSTFTTNIEKHLSDCESGYTVTRIEVTE